MAAPAGARGVGAPATRSGFVAFAGRPNVGKSTLTNAIVGTKVAIVSDKPQTTRRAIRGVASGPHWQLVLVDLPGVQRPRDALTERMQHRVERELADADGCLFVVNAQQGIGPGDRFIAELLRGAAVRCPVTIAVNKVDRAPQGRTAATLQDAAALQLAQEIFPVSARTGAGVDALVAHLTAQLPAGPFYFAATEHTDQSETVVMAELVREQILSRTREEVPHSVEVEVQEITQARDDLVRIEAVVLTDTESQKGILIGASGRMIKAIGVAARRSIERELGTRVHLELSVRVRRHWRGDERLLDR
ncbi:MAG: GTPase Era, partial [Actinomycetota bacterium]|nr:GTPase Era [Actinomycetota bacterium]